MPEVLVTVGRRSLVYFVPSMLHQQNWIWFSLRSFGALGLPLDARYADSSLHIGALFMNLSILCHRCTILHVSVLKLIVFVNNNRNFLSAAHAFGEDNQVTCPKLDKVR